MKKIIALSLLSVMALGILAGCTGETETTGTTGETSTGETTTTETTKGATGEVYYLNYKPEADSQWQELAEIYTEETGVEVVVQTAASGTYESTLKSEIAKSEPPTLFQVSNPIDLEQWKDYTLDLTDAEFASHLVSDDFVLMNGDETGAVGFAIETYGIIYNKALLAEAGYTGEDIKNFETLKAVAEDITARQDELGFAAFTSAGMDGSSDWRYKTHAMNMPIYYEYQDKGVDYAYEIEGTYLDNFKNLWDLYINNSTVSPTQLSAKTGEDAVAEFVLEEGVFYQNGTWAYGDILDIGAENLGMIPLYIGVEGEEEIGLCTGTGNYWAVNNKAPQEDIDATLDFLNWVVTDEVAVKALCGGEGAMPSGNAGMGFVTPFDTNLPSENPLVNIANDYIADGKTSIAWSFQTIPSEQWKSGVGSALTGYAAGSNDWSAVEEAFVDGWATEYEAVNG